MWWAEAGKYDVLPLDNRGVARLATRKSTQYEVGPRHVLYPSAGTVREFGAMNLRNRSHTIEAVVEVGAQLAQGVLLSMGCGYAGYALFVHEGRAVYVHNHASLNEYEVVAERALVPGRAVIRFEFTKTGEHAGHGTLFVNGERVGEGAIPHTIPHYFGGAEMAVGFNPGFAVSRRYRGAGRFAFNGRIAHIVIEALGEADPKDRQALERVALAIQ
jgi:hypothetical protein